MKRPLREALLEVAKRVEQEGKYKGKNKKLDQCNYSAIELFSTEGHVYRLVPPNRLLTDIKPLALLRTNRYIRNQGINWPRMNFEAVVKWLYENWDKVLRVLLSLLILV